MERKMGKLNLLLVIILSGFFILDGEASNFKKQQLRYSRVRQAYKDKGVWLKTALAGINIQGNNLNIFLRAFKRERILQVWVRDLSKDNYIHLKDYSFCASSGVLGPKRKQGDLQIPEGLYYVDRFNAWSNFYLSLGINYPNPSDRIKTTARNPGGDIFIHGDCVTIGCIPLTDDKIKELYVLAVEARNNGQTRIPVHIFPARLGDGIRLFRDLKYASNPTLLAFWKNLKMCFDYFQKNKRLPQFYIDKRGDYVIRNSK